MRVFFLLSLGLLWPALAWAGDFVEVRIAVVLATEKPPEGEASAEACPPHGPGDRHEGKEKKHREKKEKRRAPQPEEAGALEEELRPMQKALGLRRHYGCLQRYSKKRARVDAQGETLELPGGAQAQVRLQELKGDIATLVVSLPHTETVYQLGRSGTLYLQAGKYEDKEVWVVISPKKHFKH